MSAYLPFRIWLHRHIQAMITVLLYTYHLFILSHRYSFDRGILCYLACWPHNWCAYMSRMILFWTIASSTRHNLSITDHLGCKNDLRISKTGWLVNYITYLGKLVFRTSRTGVYKSLCTSGWCSCYFPVHNRLKYGNDDWDNINCGWQHKYIGLCLAGNTFRYI